MSLKEKQTARYPPPLEQQQEAGEEIIAATSSSKDLDDAYDVYKKQDATDLDPAEARRVLRKIDVHVLPLLMVTYCLQYLDKSSINFASVYGLKEGTRLVGQDYSWLSSIFYFGYLIAQYPAGYLLQRLPAGKFIGVTAIVWGILMMTTPACVNFAGIAANRFLLGVVEAVVNPGFVLIMAMYYQQDEQPLRLVAYYSFNGVAGVFGGLLGYAIGHIPSHPDGGLAQWQYVFLLFGAISLAWGGVLTARLPDLPSSARFLTPRERIVAVDRVAANRQGVKNHHFKAYQLWQAVRDPKTWILFVMSVAAQIPNAAQSSFTSIILETFGFDALQTQYMQIPGSAIQIISLLAAGYLGSRYPNTRCALMLAGNLICVASGAVLVGLQNSGAVAAAADDDDNNNNGASTTSHASWGRLVALWLCSVQSVGFSLSLTMVSSNVAGYTKKQTTGAFLFVGYCVGNIIGPQTFVASEAPRYRSAYVAILVGYCVKTVMVGVLYVYMWRENRRRDRAAGAAVDAGTGVTARELEREAIEAGMHDMTEIDNKGFRYVL